MVHIRTIPKKKDLYQVLTINVDVQMQADILIESIKSNGSEYLR